MATNDKPTLYYRVVDGHNPANPSEIIKRAVITRRENYSINRVIKAAIDSGRIRGKFYDLTGVINGFMDQMKALLEDGKSVNAGFMRLHSELTGQVGPSEQLSDSNELTTCLTPLAEFKLDADKFNWQRIDDNGIKLSLSTIKGEGCKIGVVKSNTKARINGRNCLMGEDGSVTITLGDNLVNCEVLGSDDDTIEFKTPVIDASYLNKEYVFTVESRCGIEDGPLQRKQIRAKIIAEDAPSFTLKVTSAQTGNENEVKLFTDELLLEGSEVEKLTDAFLELYDKSGEFVARMQHMGETHVERIDGTHVKYYIRGNTSTAIDAQWEPGEGDVKLVIARRDAENIVVPITVV